MFTYKLQSAGINVSPQIWKVNTICSYLWKAVSLVGNNGWMEGSAPAPQQNTDFGEHFRGKQLQFDKNSLRIH
jgi:hypothetical protein